MQQDDETTAVQLHAILTAHEYEITIVTILRCRNKLDCTFHGSTYCQLIRQANKAKQLEFAQKYLNEVKTGFNDIISTTMCQSLRRHCKCKNISTTIFKDVGIVGKCQKV